MIVRNRREWGVKRSLLDVLCDGLGSLRNSVPGQFSRENELDSGLNFTGGKSSPLVESYQLGSFSGNSVKSVMDE